MKRQSQGGKWQLGLWHRQENYNLPGYNIDANSYLRLNEVLDTPKQSTFPSTFSLQGTLPRTLQVLQMIAANLWYDFSNPYFTGSEKKKKKKKFWSFAKSPRGWGMEKRSTVLERTCFVVFKRGWKDPSSSVHTFLRHFHWLTALRWMAAQLLPTAPLRFCWSAVH